MAGNIANFIDAIGTGFIDFRDFVCYLSIFNGDNLEDKL
jgi:hypothetical protein